MFGDECKRAFLYEVGGLVESVERYAILEDTGFAGQLKARVVARAVLTVEAAVTTIDVARGVAEYLWVVRNSCVRETESRKVFVPRPLRVSRRLKPAAGLLNRDLATFGQPGTHGGHLWFWAMRSWYCRKDVRAEYFNKS